MTRSIDPLFDPRLADWLEEDDSTAPEQALEIVLASFPSIKQRRAVRVPWRTSSVTSTLRFGLAAAVVVAAAIGGVYFLGSRSNAPVAAPSESPQPSLEESASPNTTSFTSPLYGYTIDYPSPYSAVPATEPWTGEGQLDPEAPFADRFYAPNSPGFVLIAAQTRPEGMTDQAFVTRYMEQAAERQCAVPLDAWGNATVGDVPAQRAEFECGGSPGVEMIWLIGDTGYAISGDAPVVDMMAGTFSEGAAPSTGPNISTFTSPLYGYTVDHPTAFQVTPATEEWPLEAVVGNSEPWVDRFFAPFGPNVFVGIASQQLPEGLSPQEALAAYQQQVAERGCPVPLDAWTDTTFGEAPASRAEFACGDSPAVEFAWINGDQGWVITGNPDVIELMLESFEYE